MHLQLFLTPPNVSPAAEPYTPTEDTMSILFEPLTLRGLTVPNRVWMAPMCQYSAASEGPETGVATDWHFQHLASRAVGGAGLILTEATAVSPEGRISPFDLGIWNDRQVEGLRRITGFLADQGAVPGIQLGHAGRKASHEAPWSGGTTVAPEAGGWTPVGPSELAFSDSYPLPAELSTLYSALSVVNGTSSNAARRGFGDPEYFGFGTNVELPSGLKPASFQGPSTTDQIVDDAQVDSALDWLSR